MAKYTSGRQINLKVGVSSYSENLTSVEVIGKVGIGTTNAQQYSLYVEGDTNIKGDALVGNVLISSGIVTSNSGVVTYYGDGSKLSGIVSLEYVTSAGVSTNVIGGIASITSLSVSGVSTLGIVEISSGIVTATVGIVTYYGDGSKLLGVTTTIDYIERSGVSTNVIGGIASITSLNVSGVSTLGVVQISSGIVTATVGIVTYYGDGSKLLGISTLGISVQNQEIVSYPVYPTLASSVGVTTLGVLNSKLSYIPSSSSFGIGTNVPRENLDVIGSIGIQTSGSLNRFYFQHNPIENSIDFIFV
jgi:hypothetical protein